MAVGGRPVVQKITGKPAQADRFAAWGAVEISFLGLITSVFATSTSFHSFILNLYLYILQEDGRIASETPTDRHASLGQCCFQCTSADWVRSVLTTRLHASTDAFAARQRTWQRLCET